MGPAPERPVLRQSRTAPHACPTASARAGPETTAEPPAVINHRAANCAEPAKTSADIRTAAHPGKRAAMARTPKDTPKTKTASPSGAAVRRISLTDRVAGIDAH